MEALKILFQAPTYAGTAIVWRVLPRIIITEIYTLCWKVELRISRGFQDDIWQRLLTRVH
jgi:hypothetical protein